MWLNLTPGSVLLEGYLPWLRKTTPSLRHVKAGEILCPGGPQLALGTLISEEYPCFYSKFAALGLSSLRVSSRWAMLATEDMICLAKWKRCLKVKQLQKLPLEISCGDVVTNNLFLPNMFVLEEI